MNQSFIDAIMHFVSLIFYPLPGKKYPSLQEKLFDYVKKAGIEIDPEECIMIYNKYHLKYTRQFSLVKGDHLENLHRQILAETGRSVQQSLYLKERFLIIMALLEFQYLYYRDVKDLSEAIVRLAENLNIDRPDFLDAYDFILNKIDSNQRDLLVLEEDEHSNDLLEGSWIEENITGKETTEGRNIFQRIRGRLIFRYFSRFNLLVFRHDGCEKINVNNKYVFQGYFYSLGKNDTLSYEGLPSIDAEEIIKHFKLSGESAKITLKAEELAYCYEGSVHSVKPFSVLEESGRLIGIIGNNGVGKSTILKLIAGHLRPSRGTVLINDADLIKENEKLQSVIGFVSHDDLLFAGLSIYDNLFFQARLSLGNLDLSMIKDRVEEVIRKFGLQDIRDVRPDDTNGKGISDYHRKCINIGVEMLRNPLILCLDEPLTGLSYSDAKRLMNLLKEEVYSGKLVIMTVHLPTLELFRLYDRIWLIDYDGHLIYSGEPKNVYTYLNDSGLIPFHLREKGTEEISPEEIINLIETRKIDPDGRISNERLIHPEEWYEAFRKRQNTIPSSSVRSVRVAPVSVSGIPGIEKQFLIYLFRNIKQFLNDWRSVLIYLAGIPVISLFLAVLLRYVASKPYAMGENDYLPLYIFFLVNYIMFAGLLTASDSIFRERKIVYRDYQLNLSYFSYVNAKVAFIFVLSVLQILFIVLAGNAIVGIQGLNVRYILILFAIAGFANLLGLNLSSSVRNLSSVYLFIPFILILSMVFSGYLIRYDGYERYNRNDLKIPLIADLVPSRWGYEALMVTQFSENKYNRYFFTSKFYNYQNEYNRNILFPILQERLEVCSSLLDYPDSSEAINKNLRLLKREFELLGEREDVAPFEDIESLTLNDFDDEIYQSASGYLTYLQFQTESANEETLAGLDRIMEGISDSLKEQDLRTFLTLHHNIAIESLVLGQYPEGYARVEENRIAKTGSPVYMFPESKYGRAAFFSSYKRFNNQFIETHLFNLSFIWILNLLLYTALISDSGRIILNLSRKNKLLK